MIVVTDTSIVLNLTLLGHEDVLVPLFGHVLAPTQVVAEFQRLAAADPRFRGLVFPTFIERAVPTSSLTSLLNPSRLHGGEIAALSLAVERKADVIPMDERAGRAAAVAIGLKTMGLLGILVEARRRSLVPVVGPLLDRLQHEGRFWISPSLRGRCFGWSTKLPDRQAGSLFRPFCWCFTTWLFNPCPKPTEGPVRRIPGRCSPMTRSMDGSSRV